MSAARILRASAPCLSQSAAKREIAECMRAVAQRLGNTPAICRKSYVHPGVLDAYTTGELARLASLPPEALVLCLLASSMAKNRSGTHRGA